MALAIMAGVLVLTATKALPVAIAALAGTVAMLATGCMQFDRIGRALSFQVIVLVAASIGLVRALVETGGANWLGMLFATELRSFPPAIALAALMLFITVLTNFVSNTVAAVVGIPIAVSLAGELNVSAEPLVLAVLFACNLS